MSFVHVGCGKPWMARDLWLRSFFFIQNTTMNTEHIQFEGHPFFLEVMAAMQKKICISSLKEVRPISIPTIIRCESDKNYTNIFLVNGECITASRTLGDFEKVLKSHCFYRVNNSCLLNLSYVRTFERERGGTIVLTDGSRIGISSRRKEAFLDKLKSL